MSVVIVDYGSGNLRSAEKALVRVADGTQDIVVSSDPARVARADRIVLPGVGAFADCMNGLTRLDGMQAALTDAVVRRGVPFLGICVGMQLLAKTGHEFGSHAGLGWIDAEVRILAPQDATLKIPHMGWNGLHLVDRHPLLADIAEDSDVYFVHSFAMTNCPPRAVIATTDYGGAVVAAVAHDNIAGVQFHPEKSQAAGLRILANFLAWQP